MVEFGQKLGISDFSQAESSMPVESARFITLSAPISVQWEVTPWCNESCVHCYNFWRKEPNLKPVVSADTIHLWEKATSSIIDSHVFQATITGGEPLSVFRHIYPFIEKLSRNGVGLGLNSNLTMLNREKAQLLKKAGIRTILTSMHSADAQINDQLAGRVNTLKDVTRGINTALNEGLWVAVNMVVTKKNLTDIYKTAEYVKSLGIKNFSATKASAPIRDIDFSEYTLSQSEFRYMLNELLRVRENLELSIDSLEFYPACSLDSQDITDTFGGRMCNAGKTACTIGYNGQIRPCSHAIQEYGSVREEDGLRKAWLNLQPWRVTGTYLPNECQDCKIKNLCRGGCRTEAYVSGGNLKCVDPYSNFSNTALAKPIPERPPVNIEDTFTFSKRATSRKEDFGGILYFSPIKWAAVDPKMYNFYCRSKRGGFYSI